MDEDKKEFHELKLTKTQLENRKKIISSIEKAREQIKKQPRSLKEYIEKD